MPEVHELNTTDASNTTRFPENQAPSTLNNGGRALEGLLARFFSDLQGPNLPVATLSGSVIQFTANRVSITLTGTTSNYIANGLFGFMMGSNPNTGSTSVRINDIQTLSLRNNRGETLSSSVIMSGSFNLVVKDGTNNYFRLLTESPTTVTIPQKHIAGLTLSAAGSTATFGIAAGQATDSTGAALMSLASAYTKTTSAWAVGTGNGALDVGTIENSKWHTAYLIRRTDTNVDDVLISLAPGKNATVTISQASPGVVTWTNHGLQANTPVVFTTTGALPTGLTAGTQYYVKTVSTVSTFTVSATQGGSAINTTDAGSGTHTGTANPVMPTSYTLFRVLGAMKTDGSAQWVKFLQINDTFFWDVSVLDVDGSSGTSPYLSALASVPIGRKVGAMISGWLRSAAATNTVLISDPDLTLARDVPEGTNTAIVQANSGLASYECPVWTDTAAQVSIECSDTTPTSFKLVTRGWIDPRGKY